MRSDRHVILLLTAALAACQGDPRPPADADVQIEDSAGVRIVEYAGVPEVEAPFAFAAACLFHSWGSPLDLRGRVRGKARSFDRPQRRA